MSVQSTLEVKLFGTMRFQRSEGVVDRLPSRRVKELLAYLILNRETAHPRERLAELLWDGEEQSNPRRCLNTTLWRLNRALGEPSGGSPPFLLVDPSEVAFNSASACLVDVVEFDRLCRLAERVEQGEQAALYEQAVGLYTGDLLLDCYQDWCLVERERLQRLYLKALAWLMDFHAAGGRIEAAIGCAQRLLACDPLREDIHRSLARLHLAAGQPAAAARQLESCEVRLRREMGAGPSPETQALVREIHRREHAAIPPSVAPPSIVSRPAGPERVPAEAFALAVGRLQTAISNLDSAKAELRSAAVSVEGLARQLSVALPASQIARTAMELKRVSAQMAAW